MPADRDPSPFENATEWVEERYHDVGLPAPWEVPQTVRDALERMRQRIDELIEGDDADDSDPEPSEPSEPPNPEDDGWGWKELIEIGFVAEVISRILDKEIGVDVDFEGERNAVWGERIDHTMSVLDFVWFFANTTFSTPVAWAARLGDPMLHGGFVGPGPGSPDVYIGGRPALRAGDQAFCPHATPQPHGSAPLVATYTGVQINNRPAIRVGDFAIDTGGNNPIFAGCPTVTIGAAPVPVDCSVPVKKVHRVTTTTRQRIETRHKWRAKLRASTTLGDLLFGDLFDLSGDFEIEERSFEVVETERTEIVPVGVRDVDLPILGKVRLFQHFAVTQRTRTERPIRGVKLLYDIPPIRPQLPGMPKTTVELPKIDPRF